MHTRMRSILSSSQKENVQYLIYTKFASFISKTARFFSSCNVNRCIKTDCIIIFSMNMEYRRNERTVFIHQISPFNLILQSLRIRGIISILYFHFVNIFLIILKLHISSSLLFLRLFSQIQKRATF